jgi:hypothetical protein
VRITRKNREQLHKTLAEVYRQKEVTPVDVQWQTEVLRRVRHIDRFQHKPSAVERWFLTDFRRLMPAAGLALTIALLVAVVLMNGIRHEPDLTATMQDPVEVVVAQLFWP